MSSGVTYIMTSPTCALIMKRFRFCSLWIHITGLLIILSGYLIFGPIPQLNFIASLPLTIIGLALQGIGFSTCYIGEIFSLKITSPYRSWLLQLPMNAL